MRSLCLCSALMTVLLGNSYGADWASWRGPEHNGASREAGLVETWNPQTGENVLWESPIGGRATPIVLNGRVYLQCRTNHNVALGNPELIHAQEQVVCRDAATGEVIWEDKFNVFQTDIPAPRVGWAPMVGDSDTGNVYMHSVSGLLRCYDREGEVLWERSLFEEYGKISGYGGRTQAPVIDEDRLIVGFFGLNWGKGGQPPPKMTYYCFHKLTGELLWATPVGGPPHDTNYSHPVVAVVDGQRLLIGGGADGGVHAINARSGEPVWSFQMSKRGLNATPVVRGNYVYISHGEDNIDNTNFGRIECIDARGKGDITKTNSVWRVDGVKAGYTGLVLMDDVLYVVADTGRLYAFDSEEGTALWDYSLGTVGKGSPTVGDGKMYVMEVNGNIHILEPSREGVKSLSHVELKSATGEGLDEIYASPAISDGRVFFVTRDRTFCIGNENAGERVTVDIPEPQEAEPTDEVAVLRITPFETRIMGGGEQNYQVLSYDKNGRALGPVDFELSLPEGVQGVTVDGNTVKVAADAPEQGFELTAKANGMESVGRLRIYPLLPWKWTFDGYTGKQVPPTWINSFLKLQPEDLGEGNVALRKGDGKGRPSAYFWIGVPEMKGYTVQADVLMKEEKRKLPSVGVTAHRYNLILKGNTQRVQVQSWAPHLRMAQEVRFRSDPDVWYTVKMTVKIEDDGAHVFGKVWPRDEDEPEEWTIEAVDPHPNLNGAPGLYTYSLSTSYFDNVIVTE